jgi:hypothetical protein
MITEDRLSAHIDQTGNVLTPVAPIEIDEILLCSWILVL